jgi:predicted ATPase
MFIRSLTLRHVLSFCEPEPLVLKPLNIVIGANASGKSNLIDCIGLLGALPRDPSSYISERGGAGNWVWRGVKRSDDVMGIRCEIELGSENVAYDLTFAAVEAPFAIRTEGLSNGERAYVKRVLSHLEAGNRELTAQPHFRTTIPPAQSALSAYRFPGSPTTNVAIAFSSIGIYRDFRTGIRDDSRMGVSSSDSKHPLEEGGSNLALTLQELDFRGALPKVKDYLKRLSGPIEDIKIRAEGGRSQLYVQERGLGLMSATRLSDGTLKFLCLMAILLDPNPGPLICIEEPETGLHPDALALVGNALREASTRTQLIVTTHSDALVDRFTDEPENVVVCERDFDEGTTFRRLSREKLKEWLDEYTLGELWRRGEIGGTKR